MKKNCSKNILLISLCILFFILAGTGIYFLLKEKNTKALTVDRYQETTNWCDIQTSGDQLLINCKALLLSITQQEDQSSCFNMQIISRDDELKDLEICESSNVLSYENEILEYKILEPIDIQMQYKKETSSQSYSLANAYLSPLDNSYIKEIVNLNIQNLLDQSINRDLTLTTIDDGRTYYSANQEIYTITNSVDFCPSPGLLPDFVIAKESYTDFYNKYKLPRDEYTNLSENEMFAEIFRKLFACDSASLQNYEICNLSKEINNEQFPTTPQLLDTIDIKWGNALNLMSRVFLKQISAYYNNIYSNTEITENYVKDFNDLLYDISTTEEVAETTFCSLYKIFEPLSEKNPLYEKEAEFIQTLVFNNIQDVNSWQCLQTLSGEIANKEGVFLKAYFSNLNNDTIFRVYDQCNNLRAFFSNE